ncbi:hypothetical protein SCYAM73S_05837 [Streptomyces cyaneofuscatus]
MPASTGAHSAKTVSAARLFEPVSDLTQIPAVSHIADVPNPETTTPARQRPAVRSRRTRIVAERLIPPPMPPPRPSHLLPVRLMLGSKAARGHRADALRLRRVRCASARSTKIRCRSRAARVTEPERLRCTTRSTVVVSSFSGRQVIAPVRSRGSPTTL